MGFSSSKTKFWVSTSLLEFWIFDTFSAKNILKLDLTYQNLANFDSFPTQTDKMEYQRRVKSEEELLERLKTDFRQKLSIDFDESENYIICPAFYGIFYFEIKSQKVYKLIGAKEKNERFVGASVFQGKKLSSQKGAVGQGGITSQVKESDPLVLTWSFKKQRFLIFSNREPMGPDIKKGLIDPSRDVLNEKDPHATQTQDKTSTNKEPLPTKMLLSTSLGDIYIRLFPEIAPKAVENFATHAKNGYYDNLLFHRVVRGYVQTGDPLNDGSGGVSIWGKDFEDEFSEELKHDKPYTVSMANSGKNTNGSQFFITTMPSPWLDRKHTVFGRVYKGTDVVTEIESIRTDNFEKPYMDIRIMRMKAI